MLEGHGSPRRSTRGKRSFWHERGFVHSCAVNSNGSERDVMMPEQVSLQREIFFFLNSTIKMQRKLNPKTCTKMKLQSWLEQPKGRKLRAKGTRHHRLARAQTGNVSSQTPQTTPNTHVCMWLHVHTPCTGRRSVKKTAQLFVHWSQLTQYWTPTKRLRQIAQSISVTCQIIASSAGRDAISLFACF